MKSIKIKKNRIISVLLSMLLAFVAVTSVTFAGEVTYKGADKGFNFETGSGSSTTDLFPGFKDLMPGDKVSEDIVVKNSSDKTVEISMSPLGYEENADFLSQLKIAVNGDESLVKKDTGSGSKTWISLGEFTPGESETVKVDIEMPITVGNEYQNQLATISWQFMAEEPDEETEDPKDDPKDDPNNPSKPDDPTEPDNPGTPDSPSNPGRAKTGDDSNLSLWLSILLVGIAGFGIACRKRRVD